MTMPVEDRRTSKQLTEEISGLRARLTALEEENAALKQGLHELKRMEANFQELYQDTPMGYVALSPDGKVLEMNGTWLNILGYQKDQVVGHLLGEFLSKDAVESFEAEFSNFIESSTNANFQYEFQRVDGRQIYASMTGRVQQDDQGNSMLSHWVLVDITRQKHMTDALVRSETRYRSLVNHAPITVAEIDVDGKIIFINRVTDVYQKEDIIGVSGFEFLPETMVETARTYLSQVVDQQEEIEFDLPVKLPDGENRWFYIHMAPLIVNENVESMIVYCTDITSRKSMEQALLEDRDRFKNMVEKLPEAAIYILGDEVVLNRKAEELTGYSRDEIRTVEEYIANLLPESDSDQIAEFYHETDDVFRNTLQVTYTRKDGEIRLVEVAPYRDNYSEIWIIRDITDNVKATNQLQQYNQKLQNLLQNMPVMLYALDQNSRMVFWNNKCEQVTGYSESEMLSIDDPIAVLYLDPEDQKQIHDQIETKKLVDRIERVLTTKSGEERVISWFDYSEFYPIEGWSIWGVGIDMTEHKEFEASLQEERDHLHDLIKNMPIAAILVEEDQIQINYRTQEITGYTQKELTSLQVWFETLFPWEAEEHYNNYAEQKALGFPTVSEVYIQRKSGEKKMVEFSGYYDGKNEVLLMYDITDRMWAEKALKEQKGLLDQAESIAEMGSFQRELPHGDVICSNNLFEILGIDHPIQVSEITEIIEHNTHKDDLEQVQQDFQAILDGKLISFRYRINHPRRGTRIVEIQCEVNRRSGEDRDRIIGFVQDITDRVYAEQSLQIYSETLEEMVTDRTKQLRDTQDELVRKEKLAFLGEIAGSVSHELRNPLGVISNAVYYLQMVYGESADKQFREYMDMIAGEVADVQGIISDMLNLTKASSPKREVADLPDLVEKVLERKPPPRKIEIVKEFPDDLPFLLVDERQIRQVILNIVRNAYDAMPDGGTLMFQACEVGGRIELAIHDTGIGIPSENINRLFEPLFTTKSSGTGLGLNVVQRLVQINDGEIDVESTEGDGTTFKVRLPKNG